MKRNNKFQGLKIISRSFPLLLFTFHGYWEIVFQCFRESLEGNDYLMPLSSTQLSAVAVFSSFMCATFSSLSPYSLTFYLFSLYLSLFSIQFKFIQFFLVKKENFAQNINYRGLWSNLRYLWSGWMTFFTFLKYFDVEIWKIKNISRFNALISLSYLLLSILQ